MKLELGIMAGDESKKFLVDFTKQIDRLERLTAGRGTKAAATDDDETETADETDDEDETEFAPKKTAKKKAAAFDDEDSEEAEETETEEADETEEEDEDGFTKTAKATKAAAKTKPKKLTVNDVNDACKARAAKTGGKKGRAEVLAILKKKFKTETVSELEPEQYAAAIAAMKA